MTERGSAVRCRLVKRECGILRLSEMLQHDHVSGG